MQKVGQLVDGPQTLLEALRDVVGGATIVVPTYTAQNSISSASFRAATKGLSQPHLDHYVARMPGFDPVTTRSQDMGALAEHVRTRLGAVRTSHPQTSFAALGELAVDCTREHALNGRFGESSPLGWLHAHDAAVLLLGAEYDAFSAFHLAEYLLSERPPRRPYYCVVLEAGERRFHELWDVDFDDSDFAALGDRMDSEPFVAHGRFGDAKSRLIPLRAAVDFARTDRQFRERRVVATVTPVASTSGPGGPAYAGSFPRGSYFFLSYARLPPLPPVHDADLTDPPNDAVLAFYRDLDDEVNRRSAAGSALRPGFLATEGTVGRHWMSGLAEALGSAEVFVPLLSPHYYRRSWPRQEWAGFMERLRDAGVPDPLRRLAPVLWEPLPAGEEPPELPAALSLAGDDSLTPYTQHGLSALQRQRDYRPHYEQVVRELALRIVAAAEKAPIGPSPVFLRDADLPSQGIGGKVFAVLVQGRHHILTDAASPAKYARLLAESQGYAVRLTQFNGLSEQLDTGPGVLLVDAGATEPSDLDRVTAALPTWIMPVLLADWAAGGASGPDPMSRIRSHKSYMRRPDIFGDAIQGAGSLTDFVALMPSLVARAEREYLRHGPIQRSNHRPLPRPRLADGVPSAEPPVKENPHD